MLVRQVKLFTFMIVKRTPPAPQKNPAQKKRVLDCASTIHTSDKPIQPTTTLKLTLSHTKHIL